MATKLFCLVVGCVYLFFGISGFIPSLVWLPHNIIENYSFKIIGGWDMLYSWLPVNFVHNILYCAIGAGGILAAPLFPLANSYVSGLFWLSLLMTITGVLPFGADRLWGFLPLFGWNVLIHTTTAIACWYYGFIYPLDLGGPKPVYEW